MQLDVQHLSGKRNTPLIEQCSSVWGTTEPDFFNAHEEKCSSECSGRLEKLTGRKATEEIAKVCQTHLLKLIQQSLGFSCIFISQAISVPWAARECAERGDGKHYKLNCKNLNFSDRRVRQSVLPAGEAPRGVGTPAYGMRKEKLPGLEYNFEINSEWTSDMISNEFQFVQTIQIGAYDFIMHTRENCQKIDFVNFYRSL